MSVSDVSNLFGFIGGLGMFLYGMEIMADGMQKSAGNKMNQFLGMLTNNRFLGVVLGAAITAIIQSSSATTVMVVGFVSAGLLSLQQAVGVIMGANIGTTITAWIVSIGSLGDAMTVMKPGFYAPFLIGVGAFFVLFSKKAKWKTIGEILVGLGLLFIGLDFMSGSISSYTDSPILSKSFETLGRNPILGLLAGLVVTAIIQSSSASVGILQTLAMNGVVNTSAAIYITLGQNIGTCVTSLISSIASSRTAKRAAFIHILFNVIGALIFGVVFFGIFMVNKELASREISAVQISIFHTIFNIVNTLVLFPFANQLVKLSGVLVRGEDEAEVASGNEEIAVTLKHLDERIFESPAFAVETAAMEVVHMGQITLENVKRALDAVVTGDLKEIEKVYKTEKAINNMENMLTEYLIKIGNLSLTEHQKIIVNDLFYSVSDIERIGDHAENLVESAEYMVEHKLSFSKTATNDLEEIGSNAMKALEYAIEARATGNMDLVRKVSKYEDQVDNLEEELREKHIERLSTGQCGASPGVVFLDIISNLERVSDHAYNLAGYIKNEL